MRILAFLLLLGPFAVSARAEESCATLTDRVVAATSARLTDRSGDFARFDAAPDISLTLSCGGAYPSSVGAQYRGAAPPDAFYRLFARAGQAVTGVDPALLEDAARQARAASSTRRHSGFLAGGALVTCATTKTADTMTLCAVIEQSDRL